MTPPLPDKALDKALDGVGLIIPPPEIKRVLETTAGFLAKKPALEARIRQRHENDPLFTFLHATDPYHAYFQHHLSQLKAGLTDPSKSVDPPKPDNPAQPAAVPAPAGAPPGANTTPAAEKQEARPPPQAPADGPARTTEAAPVISFIKAARAKAEAARPEPRDPPPDDPFSINPINPAPHPFTLDVMKLAAQFAARHGPGFLSTLSGKEARNPLFDFLKPMHPHFVTFQRLIDAYKLILDRGDDKRSLVSRLERLAMSDDAVLEDVWYIHDWECQKAEREHVAAMDESERIKNAQIDWHDFVVLETVDLNTDDDELPAPVTDARQLPRILAAAQRAQHERERNRGDVDMDVDDDAMATMVPTTATAPRVQTVNVDDDIPADRIRRGAPTAPQAQPSQPAPEATVLLPSGQRVPLSRLDASMRTELVDPSYKAERVRAAEKNRQQNLADGEEVARNLARLEQAQREGGVYNRGDLHEALSGKRKVSDAEVDARLGKAVPSGPVLPGTKSGHSKPPVKRARVEAAVDALSKAKKPPVETEEVTEEPSADAGTEVVAGMIAAEEWLKKQGDSAQIRIKVPQHSNKEWQLQGQEIEMSAPLKSAVSKLKSVIAKYTKLPANKQKLQMDKVGFLKDSISLAAYNVGDGAVLVLEVKERGRKKRH